MSSDESQGYPIRRNNSCSAGESVCTRTWGTFYACCPGNSQCLDSNSTGINNFICCRNSLNCSDVLAETPTCANTSWDLYNSTGYFCCESNHAGFSVHGSNSVGCLDQGAARNYSYHALKPSSTGTSSTTPTSTSASASTSAITPASTLDAGSSTSGHSSGTNAAAIGGGVAGGVVGAAALIAAFYFLIRYRKRQQPQQQPQPQSVYHRPPSSLPGYAIKNPTSEPTELSSGNKRAELSEYPVDRRHELPTTS